MKVFITGGNGFIGTAVTDRFLSKGADVTIFDLAEPPAPLAAHFAGLPGEFRVHTGDIRDGDALTAALGAASYDYFIQGAVITAAAATLDRDTRTGCIRLGVPDQVGDDQGGGEDAREICESRRIKSGAGGFFAASAPLFPSPATVLFHAPSAPCPSPEARSAVRGPHAPDEPGSRL